MKTRAILATLLIFAATVLVSLSTAGPASAKTICNPGFVGRHIPHKTRSGKHNLLAFNGRIYSRTCHIPRPGHDRRFIKFTSAFAAVDGMNQFWHSSTWCFPEGDINDFIFRFYVTNPYTGFNGRVTKKISCGDFHSARGQVGMLHLPRCYTPWVDTSGRVAAGHWAQCHFRITVETVRWLTDPNGHHNLGSGWVI